MGLNDGLRFVHGDTVKCCRAASTGKWRPQSNGNFPINRPRAVFVQNFCAQHVAQQYVRLDEQISKLEGSCPGPRMATVEAWIEHVQARRDAMLGLEGMEHTPRPTTETETNAQGEPEATQLSSYPLTLVGGERGGNEIVANTPTKDLAQVSVADN